MPTPPTVDTPVTVPVDYLLMIVEKLTNIIDTTEIANEKASDLRASIRKTLRLQGYVE
jgi:hypothetical protein